MKNVFKVIAMTVLMSSQVWAHGGSHGEITLAKASELALHRVGKLVDLKRIEPNFVNKFYAVQIVALPDGPAGSPSFKVLAHQAPGADGTRMTVEIILDEKGKALSHKVNAGASSAAPDWPRKDPLTISENAFHYLLDNGTGNLKPFAEASTEMTLSAGKDSNGNTVAKAIFKSSQTNQKLEVTLSLDAVYITSQLLN